MSGLGCGQADGISDREKFSGRARVLRRIAAILHVGGGRRHGASEAGCAVGLPNGAGGRSLAERNGGAGGKALFRTAGRGDQGCRLLFLPADKFQARQ